MVKQIAKWSLLATGVLVIFAGVLAGISFYRVYYGRHVYETVRPRFPKQLDRPAILVFSKTNGFRDDDAIRAAKAALAAIAKNRGWSAFFTENGAVSTAPISAALKQRFGITRVVTCSRPARRKHSAAISKTEGALSASITRAVIPDTNGVGTLKRS
jgi:hypothetical protein